MSKLNRREFLKLSGISSLLLVPPPWRNLTIPPIQESDRPNILVVIFDTLSAMNMSLHGYERRTTPNLERLADRATVFHRHYAGGNFTTPGTASLLTGTYPWSHRGLNVHGMIADSYVDRNIFGLVGSTVNTFAYTHNPLVNKLLHQFRSDINHLPRSSELALLSYGYADKNFYRDFNAAYDSEALIFRNGYAPTSSFLLARFERVARYLAGISLNTAYAEQFPRGLPTHWDEVEPSYIFFTLEQAVDWIGQQFTTQSQPFFGYVHLFPPHYPFNTRHDFVGMFNDDWNPIQKPEKWFSEGHPQDFLDEERRKYDEYIAYVDAEFGRLYSFLEAQGALENTYLVLTSDHGEMFERGIYTHTTQTLYEPILNIPLLIWKPGQTQRHDVHIPTSCVDILPTVLDIYGQPVPDWCEGQALPIAVQQSKSNNRSIFAIEAKGNSRYAPLNPVSIAMIKGSYKIVNYYGYGGSLDAFELFDLENDPQEMIDLYPTHIDLADTLRQELKDKLAQVNRPFL